MSSSQPSSAPSRILYVGGLEDSLTDATLRAAFLPFGEISDVQIPMDHVAQKNRGFGFVEFAEEADARDAERNMNGAELHGRCIRVNVAKPNVNKTKAVWESAADWFETLKAAEVAEEAGAAEAGAAEGAGGGEGAARARQ